MDETNTPTISSEPTSGAIDPLESTPLAEIANLASGVPALLESFGLDYCCHGDDLLGAACTAAAVDPNEVLRELHSLLEAPATDENDWMHLDPSALTVHIESVHHAYLHEALPRLDALLDKVTSVHSDRHPELHELRSLFRQLRADLTPHLAKEEQVLFPRIRELSADGRPGEFHCGSLQAPISVMMSEHELDGDLLAELHSVSRGWMVPADGCASYHALFEGLAELERDTHLHIHKENNVLFPAVLRMEQQTASTG